MLSTIKENISLKNNKALRHVSTCAVQYSVNRTRMTSIPLTEQKKTFARSAGRGMVPPQTRVSWKVFHFFTFFLRQLRYFLGGPIMLPVYAL